MKLFTQTAIMFLALRLHKQHQGHNRQENRYWTRTSIFLSHSHDDLELVEFAKIYLENQGVSVYIDEADDKMPSKTSGVTAQKIKDKILENDKFVLIATNNAINSKWCNWELGLGDADKYYYKKIAILPIAEDDGNWTGYEYLQIYPRIEHDNDEDIVYYVDGTSESLSDWLNRK